MLGCGANDQQSGGARYLGSDGRGLAEEQETASSLGGIEQPRSTHPSPSVQQQQQTQPEDDDKKE